MNKKFLLAALLCVGSASGTVSAASVAAPLVAQAAKTAFLTKDTFVTVGALGLGTAFYSGLKNDAAQILPNALNTIYAMQMSILKKSAFLIIPALLIGTIGTVEYFCYRMSKNRLRV